MKPNPLRSWLAVAAVALCAFAQSTHAEPGFPNKPVKFLVGFGAGSQVASRPTKSAVSCRWSFCSSVPCDDEIFTSGSG